MLLRLIFAIGLGLLITTPTTAEAAKPLISFVQDITPKKPSPGHKGERRTRLKVNTQGLFARFKQMSKKKAVPLRIQVSATEYYDLVDVIPMDDFVLSDDSNAFGGATVRGGSFVAQISADKFSIDLSESNIEIVIQGPDKDGYYKATIVDLKARGTDEEPDEDPKITPKISPKGRKSADIIEEKRTVIDVMVQLTPEASFELYQNNDNTNALIERLKSHIAKIYYLNSNIKVAFTLMSPYGTYPFSERNNDGTFKTLTQINNWAYGSASVKNQRNLINADLVVTIASSRKSDNMCGLTKNATGTVSHTTDDSAFVASVHLDCLGDGYDSFEHEIGHLLGMHHDRYEFGTLGTDQNRDNYGYVKLSKKSYDVMGYKNQCTSVGITCSRIEYFSDPNSTGPKGPLGVALGDKDPANAVKAINANLMYVSGYRFQQ